MDAGTIEKVWRMSQQLQLQLYQITAYAEELAQVGTTPYPLYASATVLWY